MRGIWVLRAFWRVVRVLRIWKAFEWQCGSRGPVSTWIPAGPDGTGGYFRGGIQANFCLLFRGHGGQCLGNWNQDGWYEKHGVRYSPVPNIPAATVQTAFD